MENLEEDSESTPTLEQLFLAAGSLKGCQIGLYPCLSVQATLRTLSQIQYGAEHDAAVRRLQALQRGRMARSGVLTMRHKKAALGSAADPDVQFGPSIFGPTAGAIARWSNFHRDPLLRALHPPHKIRRNQVLGKSCNDAGSSVAVVLRIGPVRRMVQPQAVGVSWGVRAVLFDLETTKFMGDTYCAPVWVNNASETTAAQKIQVSSPSAACNSD